MLNLRLAPSQEFRETSKLSELPQVLAIISFLFLIFYFSFIIFSPAIHKQDPINISLINPWIRSGIPQNEGLELPIMFAASLLYLVISYVLIINYRIFSWFSNKIIQAIWFLIVLVIFFRTNPVTLLSFLPNPDISDVFLLIFFLVLFLGLSYGIYYFIKFKNVLLIYSVLLWIVFAAFVILSFSPSDPRDYGFYFAPALKLMQGERLGSFYMQYNVLGTYFFKWLMDFGLKLHQMEFLMRVIFIFWYFLYFILVSKLIRGKFLTFLFVVSLVILRYLSLMGDPIFNAQTTPIRLELWVPLLLITFRFGFFSPITAIAFSLGYVFDNLFGFFYLGGYLVMLGYSIFINRNHKGLVKLPRLVILAVPVIASFVFQFYYFGSLTLPAANTLKDLRLTFLPVAPNSMVWIVLTVLPVYLYLILKDQDKRQQTIKFFILILALLQLIYFFGRSHENNLLLLSGVFLLIFFLSLDKLIELGVKRQIIYTVAFIIILLPSVVFSRFAIAKFSLAYKHLSSGVWVEKHPLDKLIDNTPELFSVYPPNQKIFIMGNYDSYLNYRYHLAQVGWFTPFVANIYLDDTAKLLTDMIKNGFKVVLWEKDMVQNISEFNKSKYLKEQGLEFKLVKKGLILELAVDNRVNSRN